jgi:hypothetical protein
VCYFLFSPDSSILVCYSLFSPDSSILVCSFLFSPDSSILVCYFLFSPDSSILVRLTYLSSKNLSISSKQHVKTELTSLPEQQTYFSLVFNRFKYFFANKWYSEVRYESDNEKEVRDRYERNRSPLNCNGHIPLV